FLRAVNPQNRCTVRQQRPSQISEARQPVYFLPGLLPLPVSSLCESEKQNPGQRLVLPADDHPSLCGHRSKAEGSQFQALLRSGYQTAAQYGFCHGRLSGKSVSTLHLSELYTLPESQGA